MNFQIDVHFHKAFGWFRVFTFIRRLVGIGRSSFPWRLVGSVVDMPRRNPARACRLPQQPQQQQQARAVSFNYNRKPRFQIPIGIGTTLHVVFIRYLEASILALLLDSPLINFAPYVFVCQLESMCYQFYCNLFHSIRCQGRKFVSISRRMQMRKGTSGVT